MESFWLWPLALAAVVFAAPALRDLASRLTSFRRPTQALAEPPDTISLVRAREPDWRNPRAHALADRELALAGFAPAGEYVVHGMPELTVALYALPAEHTYAVLYDHPRSGFWAELVTRYEDGTLANYTTLEPVDVDAPEGSVFVAAPGVPLGTLWKRMRSERPQRAMRPCSRAEAARDFELGYAESVAFHRRRRAEAVPTTAEAVGRAA